MPLTQNCNESLKQLCLVALCPIHLLSTNQNAVTRSSRPVVLEQYAYFWTEKYWKWIQQYERMVWQGLVHFARNRILFLMGLLWDRFHCIQLTLLLTFRTSVLRPVGLPWWSILTFLLFLNVLFQKWILQKFQHAFRPSLCKAWDWSRHSVFVYIKTKHASKKTCYGQNV